MLKTALSGTDCLWTTAAADFPSKRMGKCRTPRGRTSIAPRVFCAPIVTFPLGAPSHAAAPQQK
jgi:hypothetical protein